MTQSHNYTQSAQKHWQTGSDAARTGAQYAGVGSPFQPRHQSRGLTNPRQSSALPADSPLGGPQVMTLRDAATATAGLNHQPGAGLAKQQSNWLAQKFQQVQQYLGGGSTAFQSQPEGPLVGIIDTGFTPGEHGHQMLKTIQQGNPDATILLADSVGTGTWANDLVQFVDVAKATGQSRAVVNLSFDLTQKNPDGTTTTRNELTASERDALLYAQQNGVLVVTSAGNNGGEMSALEQASGRSDNLIVVGAAEGGQRAAYSSYGAGLDFLVSMDQKAAAGTSQAAAKMTQTISKLWAANPNLTAQQVVQVLEASTQNPETPHTETPSWTPTKGLGIVNKQAALQLSQEPTAELPTVSQNFGQSVLRNQVWQGEGGAIATESPNLLGRLASQANQQISRVLRRPGGSSTPNRKPPRPFRPSRPRPRPTRPRPINSRPRPSSPRPSLPRPSLPGLPFPRPSHPINPFPRPSLPGQLAPIAAVTESLRSRVSTLNRSTSSANSVLTPIRNIGRNILSANSTVNSALSSIQNISGSTSRKSRIPRVDSYVRNQVDLSSRGNALSSIRPTILSPTVTGLITPIPLINLLRDSEYNEATNKVFSVDTPLRERVRAFHTASDKLAEHLGVPGIALDFTADMFSGFARGGYDTAVDLKQTITNPEQAARDAIALARMLRREPTQTVIEMGRAFAEPFVEDWNNGQPGRAIGRGLFEIAGFAIPGGAGVRAARSISRIPSPNRQPSQLPSSSPLVPDPTPPSTPNRPVPGSGGGQQSPQGNPSPGSSSSQPQRPSPNPSVPAQPNPRKPPEPSGNSNQSPRPSTSELNSINPHPSNLMGQLTPSHQRPIGQLPSPPPSQRSIGQLPPPPRGVFSIGPNGRDGVYIPSGDELRALHNAPLPTITPISQRNIGSHGSNFIVDELGRTRLAEFRVDLPQRPNVYESSPSTGQLTNTAQIPYQKHTFYDWEFSRSPQQPGTPFGQTLSRFERDAFPGDHRGHLGAESHANDPVRANIPENIIPESPTSNNQAKRVFENLALRTKQANPNSEVWTIHEPFFRGSTTRPYAVRHFLEVNGRIIHTTVIPNPPPNSTLPTTPRRLGGLGPNAKRVIDSWPRINGIP